MSDGNGSISRFDVEHVHFMPKELKPGILYVSYDFNTAAHLCACGCGSKVRTPLGSTAWSVEETRKGPTLSPSVGNWQKACQSHYLIIRGKVVWADTWTPEQIAAGRRHEEFRRESYYRQISRTKGSIGRRIGEWLQKLN